MVFIAALLVGLVIWPLIPRPNVATDNRSILNRYTLQARAGGGMVFNPGERTLLLFAPAYILTAALITAPAVFGLSAALGAAGAFVCARRLALPDLAALAVAGAYPFVWPLWSGVDTAFPPMAALCLLGLALAFYGRWRLSGFAFALAVLFSPEALIPAGLVLLYAIQRGKGPRYGLSLFGILALALVGLFAYYGPGWWEGLLLLPGSNRTAFDDFSWLALIGLLVAAIVGWLPERDQPEIALLGAWIGLYALVVGGLLRVPLGWQYLPAVGPALLLAGRATHRSPVWALLPGAAVIVPLILSLPHFASPSSRRTFDPLASADVSSVAALDFSDGLMARADVTLIALDGRFQPEIRRMLERGDRRSILVSRAPDVLTLPVSWLDDAPSLRETLTRLDYEVYDQASGTYLRVVNPQAGPFRPEQRDLAFGPDIRLTGIALDQMEIAPDSVLRLRLDWQIARPASRPVGVDLRLITPADEGEIAAIRDEIAPGVFRAGAWSTYHALRAARFTQGQAQKADLWLALSVNDGTIARVKIAEIAIQWGK